MNNDISAHYLCKSAYIPVCCGLIDKTKSLYIQYSSRISSFSQNFVITSSWRAHTLVPLLFALHPCEKTEIDKQQQQSACFCDRQRAPIERSQVRSAVGEVRRHRLTFRGEEMQSVSKILRSSSTISCAAPRASCVSASSDAIPLTSANDEPPDERKDKTARTHRERDIPRVLSRTTPGE